MKKTQYVTLGFVLMLGSAVLNPLKAMDPSEEFSKSSFFTKKYNPQDCIKEAQIENFPEPEYETYLGMKYWSRKEVILLCLGVEPEYFSENKYKIKKNNNDFMNNYFSLEEILTEKEYIHNGNNKLQGLTSQRAKYFEPKEVFSWIIMNKVKIPENFLDLFLQKMAVYCLKQFSENYLGDHKTHVEVHCVPRNSSVVKSPMFGEINPYFIKKSILH